MRERRRVLHLIQNLNYGGMEKLLADLVRGIDKRRFEVHVLVLQYLGRFGREMDGHATLHIAPPMSRWSLVRPARLARYLAAVAPDVVHSHSGVWYKAVCAARLAGVCSVVHTEHGRPPDGRLGRWLDRRAARMTDAVVAVSEPLRCYLAQRLRRPLQSLAVIPNGVDTSEFARRSPSGALHRELGLPAGQPIVGSVGRLEPVKGYEIVVEAFGRLRTSVPGVDAALVIAGEGSMRPALETLIRRLGLQQRVFLLGWRDDLRDLYAHFCCFALGSWSEGTSLSLLEAMASGIAPVVTRVGGNPDVLGSELADQAVAPGDIAAMADGMARLLSGATARRVGEVARRRVEQAYGLDKVVGAYQALYDRLVSGTQTRSASGRPAYWGPAEPSP
jgi:glycosyltransferase involved in cell wall biosynthesis